MKNINIQYPIDSTGKNPSYDGQVHSIVPSYLRRFTIGGMTFYVLDYFDNDTRMTTLLVRINGQFYKVPLTDYVALFAYLTKNPPEAIDAACLPDNIGITNTLSFEKHILPLALSRGKQEPVFDFDLYAPVNDREAQGFFRSRGCSIGAYSDSYTYHFEQGVHSRHVDSGVRAGARIGVPTYDFNVRFNPGDTGVIYGRGKDGKLIKYRVFMIPGVHRYHVTYAETDKARFNASIASSLDIRGAKDDTYRDLHDTDDAFIDSYAGVLEQQFYCPDKNFSSVFGLGGRGIR